MSTSNPQLDPDVYALLEEALFTTFMQTYGYEQTELPQASTPEVWKFRWYQKIHLIWFGKLEWPWPEIQKWFLVRGLDKPTDTWQRMKSAATKEVGILCLAAMSIRSHEDRSTLSAKLWLTTQLAGRSDWITTCGPPA
jgi:hypothetical protein